MNQLQHDILLTIESAITILENKKSKNDTEQKVYIKLIEVRVKVKQIKTKQGLRLLIEAIKNFFVINLTI